jgi:hypothetical protein
MMQERKDLGADLEYIVDMLTYLRDLAEWSQLSFQAYLIDMAVLECDQSLAAKGPVRNYHCDFSSGHRSLRRACCLSFLMRWR